MAKSKPYRRVSAIKASPGESSYYEEALNNFLTGDRSWWQPTEKKHEGCEGVVWVRKVDIENGQSEYDQVCICGKCYLSGVEAFP